MTLCSCLLASTLLLSAPGNAGGPGPAVPGTPTALPPAAAESGPLSLDELRLLEEALGFGEEDVLALRRSLPILRPRIEALLDVWYGFVGSHPQLLASFVDAASGAPDARYLAQVRERFGAWVVETAEARFDRVWLDHQHEIGLRHHSTKKNRTDGVRSSAIVPFRYLVALVQPVTATLRPFLEEGEADAAEVERMHRAWTKAVLLQVILWSRPYVHEGEY